MRGWALLAGVSVSLVGATACRQRPSPEPHRAELAQLRARYPTAEVALFDGYRILGWKLYSVAPRTSGQRCAPRWVVAIDQQGRVLAKAQLLREVLARSTPSPRRQARLCQDTLLNRLGDEPLSARRVDRACRSQKVPAAHCQPTARALITPPAREKGRLVYWRRSCVDGGFERVSLDPEQLVPTIDSLDAVIDARRYGRSPAAWAESKLPRLTSAARRDLLKRLSCSALDQRRILLRLATDDPSPAVRGRALERLGACNEALVTELFSKRATLDTAPGVRQRAIELLGDRPLSRAHRALLERIHRDRRRSTGERFAALRALRRAPQKRNESRL